ncbi:MAG: dipicolinate synthase [Oscillospiraceae bacterium]|nr:dipicolinate synthase [Oscillospiraceae bacterium]
MNDFLFLGGDMRAVYAAKKLSEYGKDCFIHGFGAADLPLCESQAIPIFDVIANLDKKFNNLVLPLPASTDGLNINAPYSKCTLPLSLIPRVTATGGRVYYGKANPLLTDICSQNNLTAVNYFEREELAIMNAVPTAEGCLEIIMRETPATVFGAAVLLTGFGRISKVLANYLTALGACVTVSARKYADLAWAEVARCDTVPISRLDERLPEFDIIINTVPAEILSAARLALLKKDCLVVDLASKTGIEDLEAAKRAGVNVIWALSLPGKTAPVTAGYIIADTIMNIMVENLL